MSTINFFIATGVLGVTDTAAVLEIAAVGFDPETAEVGGKYKEFHAVVNVQDALVSGTVDLRALTLFMDSTHYRPERFARQPDDATMHEAVLGLDTFIRGIAKADDVRIYCKYPTYQLPPLMRVWREAYTMGTPPWPTYGVICAKTIQDIARPKLVALGVDTPSRPPTKHGLLDEVRHEAIITMHSLAVLAGTHPKQTGQDGIKRTSSKTVRAQITEPEDDEL